VTTSREPDTSRLSTPLRMPSSPVPARSIPRPTPRKHSPWQSQSLASSRSSGSSSPSGSSGSSRRGQPSKPSQRGQSSESSSPSRAQTEAFPGSCYTQTHRRDTSYTKATITRRGGYSHQSSVAATGRPRSTPDRPLLAGVSFRSMLNDRV
jgi:hypothetical protein